MTEEEAPNTTFLKAVVIILGILIIGVATLIIFKIYQKAMTTSPAEEISSTPVPEAVSKGNRLGQKFDDIVLESPEGLIPISVSSAEGKMLVTYGKNTSTPEIVVVVQPSTGEVLGRIILQK